MLLFAGGLEALVVGRLVQSVLVGLGAAFLALIVCLLGLQLYVYYRMARHPGIGAVAGGLAPSLVVMAVVFCLGFLWNWRKGC